MFQNIKTYFRESYHELMDKVSWPTWSELQSSVTVVCIAALITAGIIWMIDVSSSKLLTTYYDFFK
jgi:preprotein translocase subunit SecE